MTRRVRVTEPFDVYCGRRSSCPSTWTGEGRDGRFGNYAPGGTVDAFRMWFSARVEQDPRYREEVLGLVGKRLACHCRRDRACHVDVILDWLAAHTSDTAGYADRESYWMDFARRITEAT